MGALLIRIIMRAIVLLCVFVLGCTGVPMTPQKLNINRAKIPVEADKTKVTIDGPSGKGGAAVEGAALGGGYGVGTAAVGCIPTGPLYPFCFAIISIVAGSSLALTGAVIEAVQAEDSDRVDEKQAMLTGALITLEASQNLAPLVYRKSLESPAVNPFQGDRASDAADSEWVLRIALQEFATIGSGSDRPYWLKLSARVEIMRMGGKEPVFIKGYQTKSPLQMTTTEWRGNNDELVRSALDDMLTTLATDIANDLLPMQLSLAQPLEDYKVSVEPLAEESKTKPDVIPKGNPDRNSPTVE